MSGDPKLMNLIKTSFFSAISTIIKILSGFIVNKVLSIYVGPAGIAIIGQLQNFLATIMSFSNGAISQGVVKYIAEYSEETKKQNEVLSLSLKISVVCSVFFSIPIFLLSNRLSILILKTPDYGSIFKILSFTLVLYSLNTILLSTLNGFKEIKKFVIIGIISSLVGLVLVSLLCTKYHLYGALLSTVTSQSIVFFITLFFVSKSRWFDFQTIVRERINIELFKNLIKYSLMGITTALTVPVSQLIIRNYIIDRFSNVEAGYWQGVWNISGMYLMLVSTSLSTYYLPRLSEIKTNEELRREILNGYKIILPIVAMCGLGIFLFRELIIHFLFTSSFMGMKDLFLFQIIGDFFKIASYLIAFLLLAKAMTKKYIIVETGFSTSFVVLSVLFINKVGLIGVVYAYALCYFLFFLVMLLLFKKLLFVKVINCKEKT